MTAITDKFTPTSITLTRDEVLKLHLTFQAAIMFNASRGDESRVGGTMRSYHNIMSKLDDARGASDLLEDSEVSMVLKAAEQIAANDKVSDAVYEAAESIVGKMTRIRHHRTEMANDDVIHNKPKPGPSK